MTAATGRTNEYQLVHQEDSRGILHQMKNLLLLLIALAGSTATITGRLTDPSGGVIAGVKVEATNVETNIVFSGETNMEGLYSIPDLPPGTYRVIVRKFAFRTIVKP